MRFPKFRALISTGLAASVFAAAACSDDPTVILDPEDLVFAPGLGVDLNLMRKTASGLYIRDEVVGTGPAAAVGSEVTVHYTGWLHNGAQFDSNVGRAAFRVANLGSGEVIRGWDEGLVGIQAGGRRLLVIPTQLAYGGQGAGDGIIPPYATLVFRIEARTVVNR